jgi:nucleoside 2-deoxyribosyltransferase
VIKKIYLASSWRNDFQPAIVTLLRTAGFEVYDFRNPPNKSGFAWKGISDNWLNWTPDEYRESLKHPDAEAGFTADFDGMKWADACVLLLPCGRSAHFEAGYFWGAGKPVHILWHGKNEPELMYKGADSINTSPHELLGSLGIKD